jgi:hypothetical protein
MNHSPSSAPRPISLLEVLRAIGKKPAMYIGDFPRNRFSIWHLKSFIVGFQSGSIGRGKYQEDDVILDVFTFWFCTRIKVPDGPSDWSGHLWQHCKKDDEAAFRLFFELFEEYLEERAKVGPEVIKARFIKMLEQIYKQEPNKLKRRERHLH